MADFISERDDAVPQEPVEVVDRRNRPLAVIPAAEARRQLLPHRRAVLLLYGGTGRMLLAKRLKSSQYYADRWDFPASGPVLAGESSETAILRLARERYYIPGLRPILQRTVPATHLTGYSFLYVYSAVVRNDPPRMEELVGPRMFFTPGDLKYLAEHNRDALYPMVSWFLEQKWLFSRT